MMTPTFHALPATILALLVAGALPSGAQTVPGPVARGDQALRARDLAGAREAYANAVQRAPHDKDANLMLAITRLADLFENPTAGIANLLSEDTGFGVRYNQSIYDFATERVLLIQDGSPSQWMVEERLEDALEKYPVADRFIPDTGGQRTLPSLAEMLGYDLVIWEQADARTFDENRQTLVSDFLGAGGQLVLCGRNILESVSPTFRSAVLGVNTTTPDATPAPRAFSGSAGTVTEGMTSMLFTPDEMWGVGHDFILTLTPGPEPLFTGPDDEILGLKASLPPGGTLFFFAQPLSAFVPRHEIRGQYYEVWGGDSVLRDGYAAMHPAENGYTKVGAGVGTAQFNAGRVFDYYLIVIPETHEEYGLQLDGVEALDGSPGTFLRYGESGGTAGRSEYRDPDNDQEPDARYTYLNSDGWGAFVVIEAAGKNVTSLNVHCGPGTSWPWDGANNLDTLVERLMDRYAIPVRLQLPNSEDLSETDPGIDETVDALKQDLRDRIDTVLPLLEKISASRLDPEWARTLSPDLFPDADPGDRPVTVDKIDVIAGEAGLHALTFLLEFVSAYEFDVSYEEVTDDEWDLTQDYWDTRAAFATLRNQPALSTARDELETTLRKTRQVVQALRDGWYGPGRLSRGAVEISNADWDEALGYVDDFIASLNPANSDGVTFTIRDHDPVTVNLEKLFSNPLTRAQVPSFKREYPDDPLQTNETLDWGTLPDPTLHGLFPNWTRADFYARTAETLWGGLALIGVRPTRSAWEWPFGEGDLLFEPDLGTFSILWTRDDFREEQVYVPNPGVWIWTIAADELDFGEFIRAFEVFRRVSAPAAAETEFSKVAELSREEAWSGLTSWTFNDPDAGTLSQSVEWEYQVKAVFNDARTRTAAVLTSAPLRVSRDTDEDGLGDWWELQYGTALEDRNGWDDEDRDGLWNREEFQLRTHPDDNDTDDDGMSDGAEAQAGLNPRVDDSDGDLDGDGYSNGFELLLHLDPDWHLSSPALLPATRLASVSNAGEVAKGTVLEGGRPSNDGRRILFFSNAEELTGDDSGTAHLFVRDLDLETTEMVDVNSAGEASDGTWGAWGSILWVSSLDDHRFVFFVSDATNLAPGLENAPTAYRIYVRDVEKGATTLIPGVTTTATARGIAVTPDGSVAALEALDEQLNARIYRYVTATGQLTAITSGGTRMQSLAGAGDTDVGSTVVHSVISADGRYVFFESDDETLVANDTNQRSDVFRYDANDGTVERVNLGLANRQPRASETHRFLSATPDGRYVLFHSSGDPAMADLPPDDTDFAGYFIRDTVDDITLLAARIERAESPVATMEESGRYVAFQDRVPEEAGQVPDRTVIKVYDRLLDRLVVATTTAAGGIPGQDCYFACNLMAAPRDAMFPYRLRSTLAAGGRYLYFHTAADGIVPTDHNGRDDLFVRDLLYGTTRLVNVADDPEEDPGDEHPEGTTGDTSSFLWGSTNGRYALFASTLTLVEDGAYGWGNKLYLRDNLSRRTFLVSTPGYGDSGPALGTAGLGRDGGMVVSPEEHWDDAARENVKKLFVRYWEDTDADRLTDRFERRYRLGPHDQGDADADTDADNLSALGEQAAWTDPERSDTDGDGLPDDWEILHGTDPVLADADRDPDGDGHTNLEEYTAGLEPTVPEDVDFLQLLAGWNLISVPTSFNGTPCADMFDREEVISAWQWDPFDQQYDNLLNSPNVFTLSDRKGYWIFVLEDTILLFRRPAD